MVALALTATLHGRGFSVPAFGCRRRAEGVITRVITANLRNGQADAGDLVRSAEAQADVLAFKSSPPKKLTAYPPLVGRDIQCSSITEGASGVGLWTGPRCTPQGGSTVTVWRS